MNTEILDWLSLIFRFVHVLAAIMWIGSSIFFMWMDHSLEKPGADEKGKSQGSLWMIHGGGVFFVNKRILKPVEIPKILHWFKWEAYTTWLAGFALLFFAFYLKGGERLLRYGSDKSGVFAVHLGVIFLILGWVVYDLIWRSPLRKNEGICTIFSLALLALASWGIMRFFNGHSAYLHIGAMLGTLMAGNVAMHIIPNQRKMMHALKEGKEHDVELGKNAKQRSTHNNYMTFPVLFLMLSMHFPQTYGHPLSYWVLIVFVVTLAVIKHFMNISHRFGAWLIASTVVFILGGVCLAALNIYAKNLDKKVASSDSSGELALASEGRKVFEQNACATCHGVGGTQQGPDLEGVFGKAVLFEDGSWSIADESYIKESILEPQKKIVRGYGKTAAMLAYKGILNDEQLTKLVAYIKSLANEKSGSEQ